MAWTVARRHLRQTERFVHLPVIAQCPFGHLSSDFAMRLSFPAKDRGFQPPEPWGGSLVAVSGKTRVTGPIGSSWVSATPWQGEIRVGVDLPQRFAIVDALRARLRERVRKCLQARGQSASLPAIGKGVRTGWRRRLQALCVHTDEHGGYGGGYSRGPSER
jgi:hypothetical protein